nr:hypothetical protein [Azohydromonas australica]
MRARKTRSGGHHAPSRWPEGFLGWLTKAYDDQLRSHAFPADEHNIKIPQTQPHEFFQALLINRFLDRVNEKILLCLAHFPSDDETFALPSASTLTDSKLRSERCTAAWNCKQLQNHTTSRFAWRKF